jgi:hypothetical protein
MGVGRSSSGYSWGSGGPTWNGMSMVNGGIQWDSSGTTYYVDNNYGADGNKGTSWKYALKTMAAAVALSEADIGRGADRWARRNTIFYAADTETATLAAFPQKCDVIGVGSYDANTRAGITGNHAPVGTGCYGSRFINIKFNTVATASAGITLTSATSGCQFINCHFSGASATATYAIQATASPFMKVRGCLFTGAYATGYMTFGTGVATGTIIEDSVMHGCAGLGISTVTGTTATDDGPFLIRNCHIQTTSTGLCIDDEADSSTGIIWCNDLRCHNAATLTNYAGRTGILDINEARALNVFYAGADVAGYIPLWTIT